MKKIFTPLVMVFLMLAFCLQSNAQSYWDRKSDPVSEIKTGVNYLLQNPWSSSPHYLNGTTVTKGATDGTIYTFENAGVDEEQNKLYRLKQTFTGLYLEDPDLSNGQVTMTPSVARAFEFTILPGEPVVSTFVDTDGKTKNTPEWLAANPRTRYDPVENTFENVFVFCNKNLNTRFQVFDIYLADINCTWIQYTNARIWHIYEAKKISAFDELNSLIQDLFYDKTASDLFTIGNYPGQVPEEFVKELIAAYDDAMLLISEQNDKDESVYINAKERLNNAYQACLANMVKITEGYYIIDNNPNGDRPAYIEAPNACMKETNGQLHWDAFEKPDTLHLEHLSFIWKLEKANDEGWYLQNYGTNRYAGSMSNTNTAVPTTTSASQIYTIDLIRDGLFALNQKGQSQNYPALHADKNPGLKVVIWKSTSDASLWKFIPVDASELESVQDELNQKRLNEAMLTLHNEAVDKYNSGFAYSAEGCTRDGVFSLENNLIQSADQLISNAPEFPEKEPGNAYENLLDGVFTTYFHTVWSSPAYAANFHHLDIRLDEAVKTFNIKYACRHNNAAGSPTSIRVFASNDTTNGNWTDQGTMICTYPYTVKWEYEENGENKEMVKQNFAGIASLNMKDAYKYIRLSVEQTKANGRTNGNLFWYWSELRLYKAAYDPKISMIEAIPMELRKALLDILATAREEIHAGKATQKTYDKLQETYDKFIKSYPNPQIIKDLIKEAKAQADNAVVGSDLGYFTEGAPEALKEAIAAVEKDVKDVMSIDEISEAKSKIKAALAEFNSKLIVPGDGEFYYIKSATSSTVEGNAAGNYLYAQDNDEKQVKYALPNVTRDRINFLWKTIRNDDGSYSFMNVGTGTYLSNPKEDNLRVPMSYNKDSVTLRSAKAEGCFNFVCSDNVFYNAQPGTNNLVTWHNAVGRDNSAFIFEPLSIKGDPWDNMSIYVEFESQEAKILSYPYDLYGEGTNCSLYFVLGLKDGILQLQQYGFDDIIPAATPFIMIPNAEEEATSGTLFLGHELEPGQLDFPYVLEDQTQNGMIATLRSKTDVIGGGILFESNVITAVEGDVTTANSGYFNTMPSSTTDEGEKQMTFPNSIETGIQNAIIIPQHNTGVYSISGVKIRNNADLKNLPKGVYIVGGKKIMVK